MNSLFGMVCELKAARQAGRQARMENLAAIAADATKVLLTFRADLTTLLHIQLNVHRGSYFTFHIQGSAWLGFQNPQSSPAVGLPSLCKRLGIISTPYVNVT